LVHRRVGGVRRDPTVPGHGVCASGRYEPEARVVAATGRVRPGGNPGAESPAAARRRRRQQAAHRVADVEESGVSGVEDRIERSASALRDLVWPVISDLVGGGGLIPVETVRESDFARILDTTGGIDAWQIYPGNGKSPKWIRGKIGRASCRERGEK